MLKRLVKHFFSSYKWPFLSLVVLNFIAWYPALNFWFFRAWEPSWLLGTCGYEFDLICLMRNHGVLYLLNYKLFGWNPTGWYLTAIILHIGAVCLSLLFTKRITGNMKVAFVVALLFGINVTHNDVINWGSFEGLYALLLVLFFVGIFVYERYLKTKLKGYYFFLIFIYSLALFVREAALLFPLLLFIYELFLLSKFSLALRTVGKIVLRLAPLFLLSIFYLFVRSWYGGAPNDFVDAMVQLRITLLSTGAYWEYFWRGAISFGRFAAAHIIPYPILNKLREIAMLGPRPDLVSFYFFPATGFAYVFIQLAILAKLLREKTQRFYSILLFGFLWFILPTFFFSFAFSITDDAIIKEYVWDSSRWRYFAFFGTAVFWVTLAANKLNLESLSEKAQKMALAGAVAFVLALNLVLLRGIQHEMYQSTFGPARNFYTTFLSEFPTLPEDYYFYHFPATILNDYLSELYLIRSAYYSNLTEPRNDWAENQMRMLIERFKDGTAKVDTTFFLDITEKGEVINKTTEVMEILLNPKEFSYAVSESVPAGDHNWLDIELDPPLHVEFPYIFEIGITADSLKPAAGVFRREQESALKAFSRRRTDFVENSKITVCNTAPAGSLGRPAAHLLPSNLRDGNLGGRSLWVANCRRPAWLEVDLGAVQSVNGFGFHARSANPGLPLNYTVASSVDREEWTKQATVNNNGLTERISVFDTPTTARYIRMEVGETLRGGFLELDEIVVFGEEVSVLYAEYQNSLGKIIYDSHTVSPTMRFSWETNPHDSEAQKEIFVPLVSGSNTYAVVPNESEVYSGRGEFLGRYINKIKLEFLGVDSEVSVDAVKISPDFSL